MRHTQPLPLEMAANFVKLSLICGAFGYGSLLTGLILISVRAGMQWISGVEVPVLGTLTWIGIALGMMFAIASYMLQREAAWNCRYYEEHHQEVEHGD